MAHTERRRWIPGATYGDSPRLDPNGRDDGCQHWGCNRWKRPDRRAKRHAAKALLRRDPDMLGQREAYRVY